MLKKLPGSILHCRTDTAAGSDGFAIIMSQQFIVLSVICPFHLILTRSPLSFTTSPLPSLSVLYPFFFAHAHTFMLAHQVGRTMGS